MSLITYEPFRQLDQMRREMDRFFGGEFPSFRGFGHHFGAPSIDIHQTDQEVIATCDIPGLVKKEDVHIDVDHHMLTISGTINRMNEVQEQHMYRQERYVGSFQRSVPLPAQVSSEGIKATYKNGVLEIRMPKMQTEQRKRIDVDFQ